MGDNAPPPAGTAQHDEGRWHVRRRSSRARLLVLLVLVSVMVGALFASGSFDYYRDAFNSARLSAAIRQVNGVRAYVIAPSQPPSPEGYPLLVALHGNGGYADSLIPLFAARADQSGFLLVLPDFGEYAQPYGDRVTPALNALISDVRADYPLDARGVALFGFGVGGDIATLYAHEYYDVAVVVTVGSRQLMPPPAGDPVVRYAYLFAAGDPALPRLRDQIDREFRPNGNPITLEAVAGEVGRLTEPQVAQAFIYLRDAFSIAPP